MRERLINALSITASNTKSEHTQKTAALAQAVLIRNAEKKWHLLENPNRLKIQTIDALNYRLNKQMPVLSGLGFAPEISQQPKVHYLNAVRALFQGLERQASWAQPLETVLLHLDNHFLAAETLLLQMLEKRDQWLPHIYNKSSMQKTHLEEALTNINLENLSLLNNTFSSADKHFFTALLNFSKK